MSNFVLISCESRYPIHRRKISQTVEDFIKEAKLNEVEVSITVVGSRKARDLNFRWCGKPEPTTVLTFAFDEPRGLDGILRLGDIVICYPLALVIAQEDDLLVDQAIDKLVVHGLNNLIGRY